MFGIPPAPEDRKRDFWHAILGQDRADSVAACRCLKPLAAPARSSVYKGRRFMRPVEGRVYLARSPAAALEHAENEQHQRKPARAPVFLARVPGKALRDVGVDEDNIRGGLEEVSDCLTDPEGPRGCSRHLLEKYGPLWQRLVREKPGLVRALKSLWHPQHRRRSRLDSDALLYGAARYLAGTMSVSEEKRYIGGATVSHKGWLPVTGLWRMRGMPGSWKAETLFGDGTPSARLRCQQSHWLRRPKCSRY